MDKPNKKEEDFELEDSEDYKQSQAETYKDIVLQQFRRCTTEGSKEMTSGGLISRYINGQIVQLSLPNQKEIFYNSVTMLKTMLNSQIENHENIKDKIKDINEKYSNLKKKYPDMFNDELKELRGIITRTRDYNKAEQYRVQHNDIITNSKNGIEKLEFEQSQELLIALEQLLSELNYLEEGGAYG